MKTRDFLVGLTFFGLLFVLGAFTILLADFTFGPSFRVEVPFTDVGGLTEGAEVRIDGLMVGRVRGMGRRPGESGVFVTLSFEEDPNLPDGATYAITSASALGGRVVEIWTDSDNGTGRQAADGRTWRGPGPNAMDAITKLVRDNEVEIGEIIADLRRLSGELADPRDGQTLADKIRNTVTNLEVLTAGLKDGQGLLGRLLTDEELSASAAGAVKNFEKVSGDFAEGNGLLRKLATDGELAEKVERVITNVDVLTEGVKKGDGVVGMLLTDPVLKGDVRSAVIALKSVSQKLDRGDNILAGILGDETVAKVLIDAFVKLDSAATRIEMATANLDQKNNIIGMLLTDSDAAKEVRNSIRSLSDFIETTRENAPITTFAGILLSPF